uniref:ST8 alpha-N-acetyl-neuraminide alpha-2,8-sialyltransferase 3 n=1 Tax=Cyprinus carpio carpio TaxID=630221 RepID=A0A9J7Z379_CYPCA
MVRVVSVLGLVMFSVALLILSLISYVSIKKDFIFTAPKYANAGGPRMYMFHTGFRSQLAMKFLDPAFTSLNNALNENLQESSSWRFNQSAYLQQSKEIAQYIDVAHNFTLTKSSVRVGQLMHYDYSSHKYVFSIGENLRSLLPDSSPVLNKRFNSCAVVGNSGILTGSRCGAQIDSYDYVFRCNFAPTEVFRRDVGRRTNLTTFNPSILEKYYNNLLTIQDRNNFYLSLKKLDGAILWIPAFFFHTSATVTRTLVDFFVEHKGQLKVQLAWPGNIMQYVNRCTCTDSGPSAGTPTRAKNSPTITMTRKAPSSPPSGRSLTSCPPSSNCSSRCTQTASSNSASPTAPEVRGQRSGCGVVWSC